MPPKKKVVQCVTTSHIVSSKSHNIQGGAALASTGSASHGLHATTPVVSSSATNTHGAPTAGMPTVRDFMYVKNYSRLGPCSIVGALAVTGATADLPDTHFRVPVMNAQDGEELRSSASGSLVLCRGPLHIRLPLAPVSGVHFQFIVKKDDIEEPAVIVDGSNINLCFWSDQRQTMEKSKQLVSNRVGSRLRVTYDGSEWQAELFGFSK